MKLVTPQYISQEQQNLKGPFWRPKQFRRSIRTLWRRVARISRFVAHGKRLGKKNYEEILVGLAKCIETNTSSIVLDDPGSAGVWEHELWKPAKEKGERLFKPKYGGSYEAFNQRLVPEDIVQHCVGDLCSTSQGSGTGFGSTRDILLDGRLFSETLFSKQLRNMPRCLSSQILSLVVETGR
jgi:hypothetical protein